MKRHIKQQLPCYPHMLLSCSTSWSCKCCTTFGHFFGRMDRRQSPLPSIHDNRNPAVRQVQTLSTTRHVLSPTAGLKVVKLIPHPIYLHPVKNVQTKHSSLTSWCHYDLCINSSGEDQTAQEPLSVTTAKLHPGAVN